MMTTSIDLTPAEIRKAGWEVLVSQLGVARSLRFLLENERGQGNYTEVRKELFAGLTVDQILEEMAREGIMSQTGLAPEERVGESQAGKEPERDSAL